MLFFNTFLSYTNANCTSKKGWRAKSTQFQVLRWKNSTETSIQRWKAAIAAPKCDSYYLTQICICNQLLNNWICRPGDRTAKHLYSRRTRIPNQYYLRTSVSCSLRPRPEGVKLQKPWQLPRQPFHFNGMEAHSVSTIHFSLGIWQAFHVMVNGRQNYTLYILEMKRVWQQGKKCIAAVQNDWEATGMV